MHVVKVHGAPRIVVSLAFFKPNTRGPGTVVPANCPADAEPFAPGTKFSVQTQDERVHSFLKFFLYKYSRHSA
jgi:hypothetical protein